MSSCLAAMYGTPRVLQSIANENVIPFIQILGKGVSRHMSCSVNLIFIDCTNLSEFKHDLEGETLIQ
jgi:hypothetical protein